ncbi:TRAP transporter small permease [Roseivivax marinus]|uniref:TRAP transporter small permease n=1 Tax=Roseivivax marinus TaxID=1379903 RepID=UPI0008D6BFDA|nr:TRAP transporter small permease [Roseivivax marinus]UMA63654.1 TRAP transporter small permease [Roseivivax marinus]SEL75677.1 TRAP-type C4-dicarboxylate transport system, small permease component [Roseivivax marinus]
MSYLFRGVSVAAGLLVLLLVGVTAASVVARYVFAAPFQWTEEFSGLVMIWIVFLGAIGCEVRNEHLTIDVVTSILPGSTQRWIAIAVGLVSLGLLAAMAWLGWDLAQSAVTKRTRLLGISWFWIDLAVVVGALGIGLVLARRLALAITGRLRIEDDPDADLALVATTSDRKGPTA